MREKKEKVINKVVEVDPMTDQWAIPGHSSTPVVFVPVSQWMVGRQMPGGGRGGGGNERETT